MLKIQKLACMLFSFFLKIKNLFWAKKMYIFGGPFIVCNNADSYNENLCCSRQSPSKLLHPFYHRGAKSSERE